MRPRIVDDEQMQQAFLMELMKLNNEKPYIELMIQPMDAWVLLSFLQLALRHPRAEEGSAGKDARRLALRLQELLCKPGSVMESIANRGWAGE